MSIKLNIEHSSIQHIFGIDNKYIDIISKDLNTKITLNNHSIIVKDKSKIAYVKSIVYDMIDMYNQYKIKIGDTDVRELINKHYSSKLKNKTQSGQTIVRNKFIPKTNSQSSLYDMLDTCDIVFATGPAGSSKSFTVVAKALEMLDEGRIERIVLVRPLVATEDIGALPGGIRDKVDPFLIPLYDAIEKIVGKQAKDELLKREIIKIIPLAYMRGISVNDAILILDEAQNTTPDQMKMCLSRIGENCKIFITGDLDQSDLVDKKGYEKSNGLNNAMGILSNVEGVGIFKFNDEDVIRSEMCKRVGEAYKSSSFNPSKTKQLLVERV